MTEIPSKKENVAGIEYYGFDDADLFPGAKSSGDIPLPDLTINENEESDLTADSQNVILDNSSLNNNPLITVDDLNDIIKSGMPSGNHFSDSPKTTSNVIKKEDAKSKGVMTPDEFQKDISQKIGLTKNDWSEIAQDIEDNDILNDDFLDIVELPKISGSTKNFVGKNLISGDLVHTSKNKVEITDYIGFADEEHNTSVEINRDETGDIESISVYCKCGEVTQIKFNYQEDSDINSTEYHKSSGTINTLKLEELKINSK